MGENIPIKYMCMNHFNFPLLYCDTVKSKILKLSFYFILRLPLIL